jgi:hypothetical protein
LALRIKSHWHRPEGDEELVAKSLEDIASALAFIAWRSALDKAKNLHGQDFMYVSDGQRVAVLGEYVIFQVQIADRLAHQRMDDADRHTLIHALAHKLADHMQDNATDLFGPRDYRAAFLERLNERADEYSAFGFTAEGPTYPFLRHLGHKVQAIMGDSQTNRWVIDQVMDADAPEIVARLKKSMGELLR